jgi:hypothetical protein
VLWFVKLIVRLKKSKYARDGMFAGLRIPGVENGTYGTEPLSIEDGAARLRQPPARRAGEVRHPCGHAQGVVNAGNAG